jgi:hypothetical protein
MSGDPDHVRAAADDMFSDNLLNLEAVFASFRQLAVVLDCDQGHRSIVPRQLHVPHGDERCRANR